LGDRAYNDEEVKEILRRAVEQDATLDASNLTHEELVSAAGEIGISREAVERAAVDLLLSRASEKEAEDLQIYKRGRRLSLLRGLLIFLAAAGAALGLNLLAGAGAWLIPLLVAWAFLLSARTVQVFLQDPEKAERAAAKAANKRRRRAIMRRRRERRTRSAPAPKAPVPNANPNVSLLVEEGVGLLMKVIAANNAHRRQRPQGDFGRYVKQREAGPTRARVETSEVGDEQPEEVADERTRGRTRKR